MGYRVHAIGRAAAKTFWQILMVPMKIAILIRHMHLFFHTEENGAAAYQTKHKICQFTGILSSTRVIKVIVIKKITIRIPQSWEHGMSKYVKGDHHNFLGLLFESPKKTQVYNSTLKPVTKRTPIDCCPVTHLCRVRFGIQIPPLYDSRWDKCHIIVRV